MMELNTQRMEDFKGRYKYLVVFVGLAFFLIFIRLWSLQVIKGSELRRLSENNCIRLRENPADRGMLLDRKGRILAHNRPSFEVYLVPEDLKANPEVLIKVGEMLNMTQDEIEEKMKAQKRRAPFKPVKIKSDIDWNELALLESNRVHLPGLIVDVRPRRAYDYGDLASHLIGYLGEVDENELKQSKETPYRMGALIGKYGVEYRWENDLRGVDGGRQIEVDALGREIRPLGIVEPFPGNNLFLTIDLDLQKTAEEAYQDKNGALIAMDPKTGRILAMVSKPSFDPDHLCKKHFAGRMEISCGESSSSPSEQRNSGPISCWVGFQNHHRHRGSGIGDDYSETHSSPAQGPSLMEIGIFGAGRKAAMERSASIGPSLNPVISTSIKSD